VIRKFLPAILIIGVLGACGASSPAPTASKASQTPVVGKPAAVPDSGQPAWTKQITDAKLVSGATFEGVVVWLDEPNRTIYMEDCDKADRAASEGGPYGPTGSYEENNTVNGYAQICSS
jgi:ABC-type oligopeptide transport system substrate-binding subunit